jgi:hypothetical protein
MNLVESIGEQKPAELSSITCTTVSPPNPLTLVIDAAFQSIDSYLAESGENHDPGNKYSVEILLDTASTK